MAQNLPQKMDNEPRSFIHHGTKSPQVGKDSSSAAAAESTSTEASMIRSLSLLDPIIQFLTRATGQTVVPLERLHQTIPTRLSQKIPWEDFEALVEYGIFQVKEKGERHRSSSEGISQWKKELKTHWNQEEESKSDSAKIEFLIGFPSPEDTSEDRGRLHGSTKTAAKRRMAFLKKCLKRKVHTGGPEMSTSTDASVPEKSDMLDYLTIDDSSRAPPTVSKDWSMKVPTSSVEDGDSIIQEEEVPLNMEAQAKEAIQNVFIEWKLADKETGSIPTQSASAIDSNIPSTILPNQISYAGSHPAQTAEFDDSFTASWDDILHPALKDAFLGAGGKYNRRLYKHQALAISSALKDRHTLVCTGTGSGKSLCFWIPVFHRAITQKLKSIIIFPTKALAQDQLIKLQSILDANPILTRDFDVKAATLDGDTPHSQRALISATCNIILTNPDTLHASILPNWKSLYKGLLQDLKYVVVDEAHMYEGVFGAHVAMILARLYRLHCCCSSNTRERTNASSKLVFLSCSATLAHPEHHFRLLCCIPSSQPVVVLTKDYSPKAAKHFFVWNPPLLDQNGKSLGLVAWPKRKKKCQATENHAEGNDGALPDSIVKDPNQKSAQESCQVMEVSSEFLESRDRNIASWKDLRRRHSADETALLLARAVTQGVKCIAFCKTRCLVEWVYERCISALKQSPNAKDLISRVDSYRGGYTKLKRREIEEKLFKGELLGVVGTSALELGVDIGGVEMTLHCGFPSSHASLMQQAGRAGRGATIRPSLAICVCFNSPVDQHLWRHPSSLLQRGLSAPVSMPIYPGLVQGHLLCAGQEFPLTGAANVTAIQCVEKEPMTDLLPDKDLFGSSKIFSEAVEVCLAQGKLVLEYLPVVGGGVIPVYKTCPSNKNPWKHVSIRSIESVNYDIVDLSHPMQANRMDGSHHEAAVLVRNLESFSSSSLSNSHTF
jgi:DEAD/DEAH box helicase domain-containing protein